VFAKEDFNILPEHRQWDHAIELTPGSEPKSSKVYPLSPVEQKELDSFLEENLRTRRIHPSKSPMAALVFFIKKKDGSLRLVQDYRALNSIISTPSHSSPNSYRNSAEPGTSPSWMSVGVSTTSVSSPETSGRQPSGPTEACSNPW